MFVGIFSENSFADEVDMIGIDGDRDRLLDGNRFS
jgi:hypothetical protein